MQNLSICVIIYISIAKTRITGACRGTKGKLELDYRINLGAWRKVFAVPFCIADEHHLKLASGTQIKVLLYLLAYPDMGIREELIATEIGISKEDVSDALLYWVNSGVLSNSGNEYFPSEQEHNQPAPAPQPVFTVTAPLQETASLSTPEARAALSSETHFPPKIIAGTINGSDAMKCLFQTYERLSGRPPKHAEQQALMVITEEVGMPTEVSLMLVEYCFSIGKATPAYMKAVALEWIESGIDNIIKAEERIRILQAQNTTENRLRQKFGMTNAFSQKQKATISEWINLGIPDELIDEAYDRTLNQTGKLSFPYMDKILKSWNAEGISSVSQIDGEKKPADDAAADDTHSYSKSEIEQHTLNKYKNLK